jgi:hypothetical protein
VWTHCKPAWVVPSSEMLVSFLQIQPYRHTVYAYVYIYTVHIYIYSTYIYIYELYMYMPLRQNISTVHPIVNLATS